MFDAVHDHQATDVIDLVDDLVNAPSSGAKAGELSLERAPKSMRVVEKRTEHEFKDCCGGAFGQPVELSFGRTGNAQLVAEFLSTHLVR